MDVINRLEYLGKKNAMPLKAINIIIERKKTVVPLLRTFVKNTIMRANAITGNSVTIYASITLNIPSTVKESALNIIPTSMESNITIIRFIRTKKATAPIFAVCSFNLETGLVNVIFIVLWEYSPENVSITTSAVKKGSIVRENKDNTTIGNWVPLTALNPKPVLTTDTISCPITIAKSEIDTATITFFFLYIFNTSFINAALNAPIFAYLAYIIVFQ
jgi:hypothetical protein